MYNLEEVVSGTCTIIWLLGTMGQFLKEQMHLDYDDEIDVLYNDGTSLIIKHNQKKYALDYNTAHSIKVRTA